MIQRMPQEGGQVVASDHEDDWRRAMTLLDTVTRDELLDDRLDPNRILFRLFHEDGVRVYEPVDLALFCRCSDQRLGDMLSRIPRSELDDLKIDGHVEVTCEFCNHTFRFDDPALDRIFAERA